MREYFLNHLDDQALGPLHAARDFDRPSKVLADQGDIDF